MNSQPLTAKELAIASNRAIMHLLLDECTPRTWLAAITRRGLEAAELETTVGQMLAALEHPTTLALSDALLEFAKTTPSWLVLGGQPPATDNSIRILEDNPLRFGSTLVREASPGLQELLATQVLHKAIDALGGIDRILAITGYSAQIHTVSQAGLQFDDEEWFDVSGRLRRIRKILGTTIDTLIDGDSADQRVGEEIKPLSQDAVRDLLASVHRHPLFLLRSFLLGQDRYRLLSVRDIEDRQIAILELIDPDRPRLRLQIDRDSGLLRGVERVVELGELGTIQILEQYRDYRNVAGLRIPFQRTTSQNLQGSSSESLWLRFEVGEQEDAVFKRSP